VTSVTQSEGKALVFCLTQVLISAYDDDSKINAMWVLGSLLDKNPTLQRTTLMHDGVKLILRMSRHQPSTPLHPRPDPDEDDEGSLGVGKWSQLRQVGGDVLTEVPGVAAWCLGFLCQHGEALNEAVSFGGIEAMVELVKLDPTLHQDPAQINLKQAQHAAFALRVLLQGGGREAVRRCEAVDGLDHLLQLSRTSRKKQAVENAVIAIGILTQSSRAVELSTGFESSRHGLT